MSVNAAQIDAALRAALAPSELVVQDDSDAHAGHAGAGDGSHWTVRITAPGFTGQSRIARHRLVYDALAQLIPQGIHALVIEARSPDDVR